MNITVIIIIGILFVLSIIGLILGLYYGTNVFGNNPPTTTPVPTTTTPKPIITPPVPTTTTPPAEFHVVEEDGNGNCLYIKGAPFARQGWACDIGYTDASQIWKYDPVTQHVSNKNIPTGCLMNDFSSKVCNTDDINQKWSFSNGKITNQSTQSTIKIKSK